MNAEHLLDAVGLLDDDLIREAEEYRRPRRNVRPWIGLAACLAVVVVLGYGLTHIRMGSSAPNMSGGAPAVSTPDGAAPPAESPEQNGGDTPADPGTAAPQKPGADGGDYCAAIMVDGVLYFSTGEVVPAEPDPAAIRTASSYTQGTPEEDGQSNIAPSVQYAETGMGLVVLVEDEWVLFEP